MCSVVTLFLSATDWDCIMSLTALNYLWKIIRYIFWIYIPFIFSPDRNQIILKHQKKEIV